VTVTVDGSGEFFTTIIGGSCLGIAVIPLVGGIALFCSTVCKVDFGYIVKVDISDELIILSAAVCNNVCKLFSGVDEDGISLGSFTFGRSNLASVPNKTRFDGFNKLL